VIKTGNSFLMAHHAKNFRNLVRFGTVESAKGTPMHAAGPERRKTDITMSSMLRARRNGEPDIDSGIKMWVVMLGILQSVVEAQMGLGVKRERIECCFQQLLRRVE